MKPGDVVTCSSCSAQAAATFSGRWQEGFPVALTWTHGPHPRTEVTHVAPEECIWCRERHAVLPGAEPLYRPAPGAAPGRLPDPPPASDVVARFDELAAAFHRETGIWPPGKDRPAAAGSDGVDEGERMDRWRAWCAARAAAARPPAKPKKGTQLGLFGGGP